MKDLTEEQKRALIILIEAVINGKRFRLYTTSEWEMINYVLKHLKHE